MSLDTKEIDASLSSLRLSTTTSATKGSSSSTTKMSSSTTDKKSSASSSPIADSWEEAASDDDSAVAIPTATHKRVDSVNVPNPPPPTPISPPNGNPFAPPPSSTSSIAERFSTTDYSSPAQHRPTPVSRDSDKRQEKTDAVAKRLIAGALGIKAPKKTDEQRAYDRAIREKEMRKRNEEKEALKRAEEEKAKAKAAMWED